MSSSIITSASEGSQADSTSDPGCDVGMLPQRCASAADSSSMPLRRRPWSRSSSRTRPSVVGSSTSSSPDLRADDHDLQRRLREPLPAHDVAGGQLVVQPIERRAQRCRVRRRRPGRLRGRRRRAARRVAGVPPPEPLLPVATSWRRWPSSASVDGARLGRVDAIAAWTQRTPHVRLRVVGADEDGRRRLPRPLRGVPGLRPPRRHDVPRPRASRRATSSGYLPDIAVPDPGTPMDFCAWTEVYLSDRWYTFDPRNHGQRRAGRVVIGRGRDAADVAMTTTFGAVDLVAMTVTAEGDIEMDPAG